jgi:NADH-quinone oxidoreductase subunit C
MQSTAIIEVLSRVFADSTRFEAVESPDGMPTLYVAPEHLVETCLALRDRPELRFVFLADIAAVDYYPREPRFELLYLLACPGVSGYGDTPKRLRLKVRVASDAHVPSVSSVWVAANWAEREVFDFFGLLFDGHPDLRRILMPEDWEGYPMRKDYPVQIKAPVKTYAPLQVTEEEFVANLEEARRTSRASARPEPVEGAPVRKD